MACLISEKAERSGRAAYAASGRLLPAGSDPSAKSAPASASASAIARPMPVAPPVTHAVRPERNRAATSVLPPARHLEALRKAEPQRRDVVADGHIPGTLGFGEGESLGARRRQTQRLAMLPAGLGNRPEIRGIAIAELERAAAAGHRQIGGPDEQPVDGIERSDRLHRRQRPWRLDHRMTDGPLVLGGEESVIDIVIGAVAHGAAVADAAAAKRRIFGIGACLARMRKIGKLRQHHPVSPEIERLLYAQALRRR